MISKKEHHIIRGIVIGYSAEIEYYLSLTLKHILGIEENNSVSFGNTSRALSFNDRVQLIRDLDRIDKPVKTKLILLQEIRNQFAHKIDVSYFTSLETSKLGRKNIGELLKFLPEEKSELKEIHLLNCFEKLCNELVEDLLKIIQQVGYEQGYKKGILEGKDEIINSSFPPKLN